MLIEKLNDNTVLKYLFKGNFGLEKESLRVDKNGFLSHTPHPFGDNPNIDRDFCENQVEIITDVCGSIDEVYDEIAKLHNVTVTTLYNLESGKEYLWNFSNPPYVKGEEDIPVASFTGNMRGKELYRRYLAEKYGKKKMLFSGIHFNFSFSDKLITLLSGETDKEKIREFNDKLYLHLAQNMTAYSWLVVYLTAASPLMDGSYLDDENVGKDILSCYASARCSDIGYWNDFMPILNYDSLEKYVDSIQGYVQSGQLKASSELYYPVRLKPKNPNTLENLKASGVNHIELRMIDLNPLTPIGIFKEDIQFFHLLIVYMLSKPYKRFEDFEQVMAIKNSKKASLYKDKNLFIETGWNESRNIRDAALDIIADMEIFYKRSGSPYAGAIEYQRLKLTGDHNRYAERIMKTYENDYVSQGLRMAEEYAGGIQNV